MKIEPFYLAVEIKGDFIQERYINENGIECKREVPYQPSLFFHAPLGSKSEFRDIYDKPCVRKKFDCISEAREWIRKNTGIIEILGMEDFKLTYISDTYPKQLHHDPELIRTVNFDIEVTGADFPDPRLAKYEIDAISHYDSIDDKIYVFDLLNSQYAKVSKWDPKLAGISDDKGGDNVPQEILDKVVYMSFDTEKELLLEYIRLWEEKPPVSVTGWNIEKFDIPYIMNRLINVFGRSAAQRLSPFGRYSSKIIKDLYGNEVEVFSISGVQILDYLTLYKKYSFTQRPSYALDQIVEFEVGLNKLPYDGPINKLRETNHQRYISYNIVDVYCVQMIDFSRGFIELVQSMAYHAKINYTSVLSPVKYWDSVIYNSVREDKQIIPASKSNPRLDYEGAYVKEPVPGQYKYVISVDVTSLYPSIIRQVNISPETIAGTFAPAPRQDYINGTAAKPSNEFSCSMNGMMYRKDKQGIIPREVEKVFFQRKEFKAKMLAAERNIELIKTILKDRKG